MAVLGDQMMKFLNWSMPQMVSIATIVHINLVHEIRTKHHMTNLTHIITHTSRAMNRKFFHVHLNEFKSRNDNKMTTNFVNLSF